MPEYLAPGVFVEEVSFRSRSIEGVSTSTTGFVGPSRFGPTRGEPPILTSFADFERTYGGLDRLRIDGNVDHNYLAHAVRAYFEEGGRRLYVSRVFEALAEDDAGLASASIPAGPADDAPSVVLSARHPGAAGNFMVTLVFRASQNILIDGALSGAREFDTVARGSDLFWLERFFDSEAGEDTLRLHPAGDGEPVAIPDNGAVQIVTVSVVIGPLGRFGSEQIFESLTFHPDHPRSLSRTFPVADDAGRSAELFTPLVFTADDLADGAAIADLLLSDLSDEVDPVADLLAEADGEQEFSVRLADGNDGGAPDAGEYGGTETNGLKNGLLALEDVEDISIVAAPASTDDAVRRALISHCERMRYRIGVLDPPQGQTVGDVRALRASLDSTRAALYYPWVRVFDPVTERDLLLPPSGFVTGIYARNDVENGVHKAPANEVVRLATGLEFLVNRGQQEVLNPDGINCLRFFEGRGFRVWGARTISSDAEWRYVNVRRYMIYLERSIERGTQFAVFENNGPVLWANVRSAVEDFLFAEWSSNRLLGGTPEAAFFVRCDRTTITQNDLDNGRLICLVGVAVLKPAEFVIFRIGQMTAEA